MGSIKGSEMYPKLFAQYLLTSESLAVNRVFSSVFLVNSTLPLAAAMLLFVDWG